MSEEKEVTQEQDWDKEKQRADMEHANFLKAKQEKEALQTQVKETLAGYEDRIKGLEEQIKTNKVELSELDPLRADVPDLVNQNQKLIQALKGLQSEQAELKKLASEYRQKEQQREAKAQRDATIDKICKPLDKKYGASLRNKAIELAESMVAEGKVSQPTDALDARDLMEECYQTVKTESETKKKESIPTDSGTGAFSFISTEIPEGSLNEVVGKIRQKIGTK